MINQCYIRCKDYYLFSCSYVPDKYEKVILLLQGYSHSMTDIDYFMSNLKNELIDNNCAVVQFDPFGHGDSDGQLEKFDYYMLKENIIAVIEWICENWKKKPILVTRGLYTLLAEDTDLSAYFSKKILLNPIAPTYNELKEITNNLTVVPNIIDFKKWFNKIPDNRKAFFESVFYTLGAKLMNLQGQYFNQISFGKFIDKMSISKGGYNNVYLVSNNVNEIILYRNKNELTYCSFEYYFMHGALPRDPDWHFKIIETIVDLCIGEEE